MAADPEVRSRALGRMRDLAVSSSVPITFGLVATPEADHLLDFLDETAAAGGRAIAQTHCRGISVLLSLKTRLPFDLIDAWSGLRARPSQISSPSWATPRSGGRTSRPRSTPITPVGRDSERRPGHPTSRAFASIARASRPTRPWPTSRAIVGFIQPKR